MIECLVDFDEFYLICSLTSAVCLNPFRGDLTATTANQEKKAGVRGFTLTFFTEMMALQDIFMSFTNIQRVDQRSGFAYFQDFHRLFEAWVFADSYFVGIDDSGHFFGDNDDFDRFFGGNDDYSKVFSIPNTNSKDFRSKIESAAHFNFRLILGVAGCRQPSTYFNWY